MNKKWTRALMALGFSLFLLISACDQGGGGREEKGGSPGVTPGERTDRPAPAPNVQEPGAGTQGQQPRTQEQPGATGDREGTTGQAPGTGGTGTGAPTSPPAS